MKASKVIVIGLAVATVIAGSFFLPVDRWFAYFEKYVQALGIFGPVAVAVVYVICTVLLVPGSAISIGAGTIFGFNTGFLVVLGGREPRRALFVSSGAHFSARKDCEVGRCESKVSIF